MLWGIICNINAFCHNLQPSTTQWKMVIVRCSKYEISTSEPSKGEHKHAYNRQQLSICNYFPSAVLRRWSELGFYSELCLQLIQFYLYENKKWLYAVDLVGSMGHWYWVVVRKTCYRTSHTSSHPVLVQLQYWYLHNNMERCSSLPC